MLKLKEEESRYSEKWAIESNIRKYSNFVGFPILVDGDRVNTIDAVWLKSKNEVMEEQHSEFYKYISQGFDEPRFTLHYATDAPVSIKAALSASRGLG